MRTLAVQAAESSSPLVPAPVDALWFIGILVAAAAMVVALVAWSRNHRQGRSPFLELLVIVLLPLVGPVAYLVARRQASAKG